MLHPKLDKNFDCTNREIAERSLNQPSLYIMKRNKIFDVKMLLRKLEKWFVESLILQKYIHVFDKLKVGLKRT